MVIKMVDQKQKVLYVLCFAAFFLTVFQSKAETSTPSIPTPSVRDLLNPDSWFRALKQNITIPASKDQLIKPITLPKPEETLQEISPTLQQVNKDVREETGIDFAKFIGWFSGVLKVLFQIIVNILEVTSKAMKS